MSMPIALPPRDDLPRRTWLRARIAVAFARPLAACPPARLRKVLTFLRKRAHPATYDQALAARNAVVAVSLRCAGRGCLQRSIATVLLCRTQGAWPDWSTGVRTRPFRAHAWVEVDGVPVGEPVPADYYLRTMTTRCSASR